jgi:hypothetical protein
MSDKVNKDGGISAPANFLPGGQQVPVTQEVTPPTPAPAAAAATPAPAAATPTPAPAAPPVVTQPTDTPVVTPAVDPFEAAIEQSMAPAPTEVVWDDTAKNAFKSVFGAEDPLAYKTQIETERTEAQLAKQQLEQLTPLKQQLDALPPALHRAFMLAAEGKVADAQEFLKGLPTDVLENREAKNIPSDKLIEMYLPGKMSKEDFAKMKDPDTDPDVVDALKLKEKHLREVAVDMHERQRQSIIDQNTQASASLKQRQEQYTKGIAETVAAVQADPLLRSFADQSVINDIQSGAYIQKFIREDGITPTKEAGILYLKALHFDQMAKAQYNVGYRKGKSEAMLEAASGMRGAPPTSGRDTAVPSAQRSQEQQLKDSILSSIGAGRR